MWWDKINTLEREPWGDGSPPAAWTKGFFAARGIFFAQKAAPSKDSLGRWCYIVCNPARINQSLQFVGLLPLEGGLKNRHGRCTDVYPWHRCILSQHCAWSAGMKRKRMAHTVSLLSAVHRQVIQQKERSPATDIALLCA